MSEAQEQARKEVLESLGVDPMDTAAVERIMNYHPFIKRTLEYAFAQQECIKYLMQLIDSNRPH